VLWEACDIRKAKFLTSFPRCRLIFVTNHLPLIVTKDEASGWSFEWDPDALVLQAKEGLPDDMDAVYVGCLNVEIEGHEQEVGQSSCCCSRGRIWCKRIDDRRMRCHAIVGCAPLTPPASQPTVHNFLICLSFIIFLWHGVCRK
jgi:hypothetical protein